MWDVLDCGTFRYLRVCVSSSIGVWNWRGCMVGVCFGGWCVSGASGVVGWWSVIVVCVCVCV